MSTQTASPPGRGLRAEMKAIDAAHALHHWHAFLSDTGRVWASSPHCEDRYGSGTTVDGTTCEGVNRAIAVVEREWAA